jgi:predicted nucleic acid-binding protein
LIALWNRSDQWHAAATTAFQALDPKLTRLITTSYILLECGNEAARRPYRDKVIALRADLGLSGDLIEPTPADIAQGWADYTVGLAGTAGIVDHVSFAVMRRLRVTEVFTNDRHFSSAGFTTLF